MQTTRLQREGHIYTVTNVMCICVSYKQRTVPPHFTEKQAKSKYIVIDDTHLMLS
jgi:hypothetical protein